MKTKRINFVTPQAENFPERVNLSSRDKCSARKVSLLWRFDCIIIQVFQVKKYDL